MAKKQKKETLTWGPNCGYEDELDQWFKNQSNKTEALRFLVLQHILIYGDGDIAPFIPNKLTKENVKHIKFPHYKMDSISNEESISEDQYVEKIVEEIEKTPKKQHSIDELIDIYSM